jgi:hypothetical protein
VNAARARNGRETGGSAGGRRWLTASRIAALALAFVLGTIYGTVSLETGAFPHRPLSTVLRRIVDLRRGVGDQVLDRPAGFWNSARGPAAARGLTEEEQQQLHELMTLGYVDGSVPATGAGGVTYHVPDLAFEGLNLYTSGHAAAAFLLDMDGEVLHTWKKGFLEVWPDYDGPVREPARQVWRRAYLYENGDLLAVYDHVGIVKLDRDSNLLWSRSGGDHHDLDVLEDGLIYVLEQDMKILPRVHEWRPVSEQFIAVLRPDGSVEQRVSILEAFENSDYRAILNAMPPWGDILHANTIEVLDGRFADAAPAFRRGNVLICLRSMDVIAVVDMETEAVVWALVGRWDRQHQPTFISGGRMLLFNNEAGLDANGSPISDVIEFDPLTQEVFWSYDGNRPGGMYSAACGSCQRLGNGNTLISETDNGRAIEVTRDGGIVWEFINPERAGENDELIASLYEVIRLPADFPVDWARGSD